jgi:iron-sulfur cluster insertion protein
MTDTTTTEPTAAPVPPPSPVELTDAAVAKVAQLIAEEGDDTLALRMAVRPGGCSGFN